MRTTLLVPTVVACALLFAGISAAQNFNALIDGLQEVPPVTSPGTGIGCFTLNPDNTLSFNITFGGLLGVETAAHIHGPAPIGVNAGVIFPLPLGSPKIGVVGPLTAAQVADLAGGLHYVNIHSTLFPGGEIRGQILTGAGPPLSVDESSWGRIKATYAN